MPFYAWILAIFQKLFNDTLSLLRLAIERIPLRSLLDLDDPTLFLVAVTKWLFIYVGWQLESIDFKEFKLPWRLLAISVRILWGASTIVTANVRRHYFIQVKPWHGSVHLV